jgi:uncharacterized protein YjiS (DUF1127 family)
MQGTLDKTRRQPLLAGASLRARPLDRPGGLGRRIVSALVARGISLVRTWVARGRDRRLMRCFTERDLRDIGLTRAQVHWEIGKPFWRV